MFLLNVSLLENYGSLFLLTLKKKTAPWMLKSDTDSGFRGDVEWNTSSIFDGKDCLFKFSKWKPSLMAAYSD